ncbi:MAG TPA: hypothetical protein VE441_00375 [Mycobacterium sp.]|nr:hypothetical protein [Mycobacterium sp.]
MTGAILEQHDGETERIAELTEHGDRAVEGVPYPLGIAALDGEPGVEAQDVRLDEPRSVTGRELVDQRHQLFRVLLVL